jgi:hypothetical protein
MSLFLGNFSFSTLSKYFSWRWVILLFQPLAWDVKLS